MFLLRTVTIFALLFVSLPAGAAEDHVVDQEEILSTLTTSSPNPELTRDTLLQLLERPATREIADAHDIDLSRARDVASSMSDADVRALAPYVAQANGSMVGGDKLVIGSTTVIIILLVLLLVAVA